MRRHALPVAVVLTVVGLLLSGCAGPTFSSLPLPGTGVSGRTIEVRADFDEALNLARGAEVRVNGVASGRVVDVAVHDFRARVTMTMQRDAEVRRGVTARLRYTTPLGELFVDLHNPTRGPLLRDGAMLPLTATSTAPTVEDSLASASLLINGGGLAQLQTITTEANQVLGGREGTVRDLIGRSSYLLGQANAASRDLDRALNALDGVSRMLGARRDVIHRALVDVRPASRVLRANLDRFTSLLATLQQFGGTANDVVRRTRAQVLELVREAGPLLAELVSVRGQLPATLAAIVALSRIVDTIAPGDYLNLGTHLRLDSTVINGRTLGLGTLFHAVPGGDGLAGLTGLTGLTSLPGLTGLGSGVGLGITQGILSGLLGSRR